MNQLITIEVPEGKEIVQEKETDGSIRIGFINKKSVRSKSWEEFCKNHPQISYEYFLQQSQITAIHPTTETRMNFRHTHHGE